MSKYYEVVDSEAMDKLIGGTTVKAMTANVTLASDTVELKRGAVLGTITVGGQFAFCDNTQHDGREKATAILAEDISLTGSTAVATVYTRGEFNREALALKQHEDTVAKHEAELRAVGIYLTSLK